MLGGGRSEKDWTHQSNSFGMHWTPARYSSIYVRNAVMPTLEHPSSKSVQLFCHLMITHWSKSFKKVIVRWKLERIGVRAWQQELLECLPALQQPATAHWREDNFVISGRRKNAETQKWSRLLKLCFFTKSLATCQCKGKREHLTEYRTEQHTSWDIYQSDRKTRPGKKTMTKTNRKRNTKTLREHCQGAIIFEAPIKSCKVDCYPTSHLLTILFSSLYFSHVKNFRLTCLIKNSR